MTAKDNSQSAWDQFLLEIENKNVIPVIGPKLYRFEIESRNSLLYEHLAEVVSRACKTKLPLKERSKFHLVCEQYLSESNNGAHQLTRILKNEVEKVTLKPTDPLWKLARMKWFNFFLNTTYDDLLFKALEKVRKPPTLPLAYAKYFRGEIASIDIGTSKSIRTFERNLVFNIFGNLSHVPPAYTKESMIETFLELQKEIERSAIHLLQSLVSSNLLFIGFEYDDWLFRYLINTLSRTAFENMHFKLIIRDDFENKSSGPFHQGLEILKTRNALGFYPTKEGDFVELLFHKMENENKDKIALPNSFSSEAFVETANNSTEEKTDLKSTDNIIIEGLKWERLTPERFERLIFNLISTTENYENPKWSTKTNAPDRGRDLSVTRVVKDQLGDTMFQRVIIQCKHWLKKSLSTNDIIFLRHQIKLLEPPNVDVCVIASSGLVTDNVTEWVRKENDSDTRLRIELWERKHLEMLLASRQDLLVGYGLL